eukprot:CAMPEP_0115660226 /NCGR_PEP_ID=MMETSP0272-20121206/46133_1 /TAXON_ID=71861 /ORGANISM="Scrippsiella trochoidea, Strain CCMP3099" /LENGTH=170 /DNA_ID=CAMNT_0003098371 /DNA_START=46 /DNA_END=556 /DNA_ORIENTATION=-
MQIDCCAASWRLQACRLTRALRLMATSSWFKSASKAHGKQSDEPQEEHCDAPVRVEGAVARLLVLPAARLLPLPLLLWFAATSSFAPDIASGPAARGSNDPLAERGSAVGSTTPPSTLEEYPGATKTDVCLLVGANKQTMARAPTTASRIRRRTEACALAGGRAPSSRWA